MLSYLAYFYGQMLVHSCLFVLMMKSGHIRAGLQGEKYRGHDIADFLAVG